MQLIPLSEYGEQERIFAETVLGPNTFGVRDDYTDAFMVRNLVQIFGLDSPEFELILHPEDQKMNVSYGFSSNATMLEMFLRFQGTELTQE